MFTSDASKIVPAVVSTAPATFKTELEAFVHVDPATDPVKLPLKVTVPLLVTVIAPVMANTGAIVRLVPAETVLLEW